MQTERSLKYIRKWKKRDAEYIYHAPTSKKSVCVGGGWGVGEPRKWEYLH